MLHRVRLGLFVMYVCFILNSQWLCPVGLLPDSSHVPHGQKELHSPCHSRVDLVETPPALQYLALGLQQGKQKN